VLVAAAVLGGAFALGVGKSTGWFDADTRTVVVNAQNAPPAALPSAARSNAAPLPGKGFDPARIFSERSPGVVTIFAYFGDPTSETTTVSQGSGFVISPKGYVLTNSHVITNAGEGAARVEAAETLYVEYADGDREEATIVGWDLYDDVGLIKIKNPVHKLTPVPLGSSRSVIVGQPVAAIGSPLGNENSLSVGVVSAVHRSIDAITVDLYRVIDAIQTDAPITHGNSGGPLFDARGRVIGINAQIRSVQGRGNDSGIGFAIPIDAAKRSVQQLIDKGRVTYAFVGIRTDDLTPTLARALGYKIQRGALIVKVDAGTPAAQAGLRAGDREVEALGLRELVTGGDVIVAINGTPVRSADDVVRIVSFSLQPGDVAAFTIVRDGKRRRVAVKLAERQLPSG
jgi:2-alkenal reductase